LQSGNATNPQGGTQNLFQYADELDGIIGRHQIFIGPEADRIQFDGGCIIYKAALMPSTGSSLRVI
jgi:hypothetical protein